MKKRNRTFIVVLLVIVVAVGLLGFNNIAGLFRPGAETADLAAQDCIQHISLSLHIHPHLDIIVDGGKEPIPANIGVTPLCMRPVHTHDETGTIHIEWVKPMDFELRHFFAMWEKPFSKNQILDNVADAEHEIVMTVDGKPSEEFENLVMRDNQQIVIEHRPIKK